MTASLFRAGCRNELTAAETASLIAAVLQPPAADSLPAEDPWTQPGPLLNASPDAKGAPAC